MAQKVTIVSDYSGQELKSTDTAVQVNITVKVGSEAGKKFDLDFSQDELDEFLEALESSKSDDPQPIRPQSQGPAGKAPKAGATETDAKQEKAWNLFNKHKKDLKLATNKEMADVLDKWLADNPVPKDRGDGNFTKITPTKQAVPLKVMEEYDNQQKNT